MVEQSKQHKVTLLAMAFLCVPEFIRRRDIRFYY